VRWAFFALIVVHGLIHLMGPARAFGLADLPQLSAPVSRTGGLAWLLAAVVLLTTAVLFLLSHRLWWAVGLAAVIISQAVIFSAWGDAKVGTLVNVVLLLVVAYGFMSQGPLSFRAEYQREVTALLSVVPGGAVLTEEELEPLPEPVRRYVRLTGAVGRPRPLHFRAEWRGRIRAGPDDPWMEFTAEQHNFLDEPARFFFMDAVRGGLPADVYHAYRGGQATMRVRLLSLVPMVDARGPEMDRAETVTVFNDLALLAPGGLSDPAIAWEAVDDTTARARYTVAGETVTATLHFAPSGELVDFVSDDRLAATDSGFVAMRWSTPVEGYRDFGELRAFSRGVGM